MTPEQKAREIINRMLNESGWEIVNRDHYSPNISAVAIEEGILRGSLEADYLLFINGKAIGILEAKKEEYRLSNVVMKQAERYVRRLPNWCSYWYEPLPIIYLSNGKEILFKNINNLEEDYLTIPRIHSPREIVKMLGIEDEYAGLPSLQKKGLRDCQYEAITELESSFRLHQSRALMVLATGAGKTFTACMAAYRLLSYTSIKRVLFLVDRNNLGRQAEGEFGTFRLTETGEPFNTIFTTERLKSAKIPKDANVVISTIQRLFALLTGQELNDNDDDESYNNDGKEIQLDGNLNLSPDFFDLIIIDECHRSIYGNWRKVLEYFKSAKMVGLTATPAPETLAFFNNNRIVNYTLEKSIADGINVDYRVFRIKTQATENGGAVKEGENITQITKYSGKVEDIRTSEEKTYTSTELNRSIINPSQIKLILETYRDSIYNELYPDREPQLEYIPKTLIFALNDAHATNIVRIAKEVFPNQSENFIQKITYSAGDSNQLIRSFRNDKNFRIAVTVTLVATGTDVKPLEVVMFMRDVESDALYTQMKGRGVRTIGDEQLRNVTPNAVSKDLFFLVDAVGITEHEMQVTRPGADIPPPNMSLRILLERITHGDLSDDNLRLLASRLSRINIKSDDKQRQKFTDLARIEIKDLAVQIFSALEEGILEPFIEVNNPNLARKGLVRPLTHNPKARQYLLELNAGFISILQPGEDNLIEKGFSIEEAQNTTQAFEDYVNSHKDEIEALRIIYNNTNEPITYTMLKELREKLIHTSNKFNPILLWNTYSVLDPAHVVSFRSKDEKDALTNIIQLVRFAFKQSPDLRSLSSMAASRFELWCGQNQRPLTDTQKEIIRNVINYIVANGSCNFNDIKEEDKPLVAQMVRDFGTADSVNTAIISLSQFILKAA
ncbi:type I restriction endonuclease subunit R [Epilithonimonas vandammei]|uniref:type I restriction endonuclease subunit R n=1 Tax=Epilithonimonas vandammei TaxID=2487072 RepID=UPI0028A894DE|nr:DEAD/DEAH box helicase family protein [Epilithonimonas vandammei]